MDVRISVLLLIFAIVGSFTALPDQQFRSQEATLAESSTTEVSSSGSEPTESSTSVRPTVTSTTASLTNPTQVTSRIEANPATESTTNTITNKNDPSSQFYDEKRQQPMNEKESPCSSEGDKNYHFAENSYQRYYPMLPYKIQGTWKPIFNEPTYQVKPATGPQFPMTYPIRNFNSNPIPYSNFNPIPSNFVTYHPPLPIFHPRYSYPYFGNLRTPPYAYFNHRYDQQYAPSAASRSNFNTDNNYSPFNGLQNYQCPYCNEQFSNYYPARNWNQGNNLDWDFNRSWRTTVTANELTGASADASATSTVGRSLTASSSSSELVHSESRPNNNNTATNVNDQFDHTTPGIIVQKQPSGVPIATNAIVGSSVDTHSSQVTTVSPKESFVFPDNIPTQTQNVPA